MKANREGVTYVSIDDLEIEPDFNPRKIGKLEDEFIESVKVRGGLIHPIIVRRKKNKLKLFIVDGHRRYAACVKLGIGSVPVLCLGIIDDKEALEIALQGNKGQKKLTGKETQLGIRKLHYHGHTPEHIAGILLIDIRTVNDALKVADKAIPAVKKAVEKGVRAGGMDPRVGSRVAELPKAQQKRLMPKFIGISREEGLAKVRQVERKVGIKKPGPKPVEQSAPVGEYFAPDVEGRCRRVEAMLEQLRAKKEDPKILVSHAIFILKFFQNKISLKDWSGVERTILGDKTYG